MNKTLSIAAVVLVTSIGTAAFAQEPATKDKPLSIRIGATMPGGYAAQNNGGKSLLFIGTDYAYSQSPSGAQAHSTVFIDGLFGSKSGGHVEILGFGASVRTSTPMGSSTKGFAPYAGAGTGFYRVSIKNGVTGVSQTKNGVGEKVFAGVALGGQFFVEGSYLYVPKASNINPSGFGLQIGSSF